MKNEEIVSMQLLLGYLGFINIMLLSPVLIIMGILHFEELHILTMTILGYILLNGFFDNVISDYLWARSVILTSPTVATVGLSLTIPFAIITDVLSGNHSSITYVSLIGASFVLSGFFLINLGIDPIYKCLGYQIDE
jgi:solute carrier family 35 protein F5